MPSLHYLKHPLLIDKPSPTLPSVLSAQSDTWIPSVPPRGTMGSPHRKMPRYSVASALASCKASFRSLQLEPPLPAIPKQLIPEHRSDGPRATNRIEQSFPSASRVSIVQSLTSGKFQYFGPQALSHNHPIHYATRLPPDPPTPSPLRLHAPSTIWLLRLLSSA